MNKSTWTGLVFAGIGLLGALAAVLLTAQEGGLYFSIGMLAMIGGVFLLLYRLFIGPLLNARRLQKTGLPALARILEVADTGVTINNSPQVKITLELKNHIGQRYTTVIRALVSRLNPAAYRPGMEIPVLVDPGNEKNVIPDPGRAAGANPYNIDQTQLSRELLEQQDRQQAVLQTGIEVRAIVRSFTWLGVNVNGNNPYAELQLEILPADAPSFTGTIRSVIMATSVPRYQPGQEIRVKYDPNDNTNIAIVSFT